MLTLQHKKLCTHLKPMAIGGSALYERIQANYNIIGAAFEKEELLHLVSAPPEVYLEEGGASNIIQNTGIHTSRQVKVDIVNNLLNRIMLYGTQEFSYQDSVYITSVLHKLGIQDVNLFMEQVKNLMKQEDNSVELTRMYQDNRVLLTKLFREQMQEKEQKAKSDSTANEQEEGKSIYYLHQEIMKRLQTARIYDEVISFTRNIYPQSVDVQTKEYLLSEHEKLSREYYRQELKNTVLGTDTPLLWQRVNVYEQGDELLKEDNRTTVEEQITSAVLLNLADNLYTLRKEQIENNRQQWFDFHKVLFMTSRDTIERVEAGLHQERLVREQNYRQDSQVLLENLNHERELLERLVDHVEREQTRQLQDRYFTSTERVLLEKENNTTERYDKETQVRELFHTAQNELQTRETDVSRLVEKTRQNDNTVLAEHDNTEYTQLTRELERSHDHTEHEEQVHTHTDMVHRQNESHTENVQTYGDTVRELLNTVENHSQEKQSRIERIREQMLHTQEVLHTENDHTENTEHARELERSHDHTEHEERVHTHTDLVHREDTFHTQEVENYGNEVRELVETIENRTRTENSSLRTTRELREQTKEHTHTEDRTEQNTQTRELLERMESHEKTVLHEKGADGQIVTSQRTFLQSQEQPDNQVQISGQEQPVTMENVTATQTTIENQQINIENLEQELLRINEQNIANYNRVMEKVQQETKQKATPVRIDKKLAMQEGIRALGQEPKEVVRTFLETPIEPTPHQETEQNAIYNALPQKLREVFKQIEQQGSMETNETVQTQRTQAAMNLLVRDIQEVSENRTQENVTRQELHRQENRQEELIHKIQENVVRQEAEITNRNEKAYDRIRLVHRKQEQQIDEELLESLREERTQNRQTIQNTQVVEQNQIMQEHQINTTTRNVTVEQHQDINELVREGVRKELGTISDKVYNQIERRLQSERKRRGY